MLGSPMTASPKIQILERAMGVLGMFGPRTPTLSMSEIAERLGMYPSTAHRLLHTLEDGGFLMRDKDSSRYALGPRLLELATQAMTDMDVRRIAEPHLRELLHEFGEAVSLGYYDNGDVVYLESLPGLHSINIATRVGARHPAHCVASGRAMLAHMPDEAERLAAGGLSSCGARSVTADDFKRDLATIRRRGYALDNATFMEGVRATASVILDHENRPISAVTVVAPSSRFPQSLMTRAGKRVQETAEAISAELRHGDTARRSV
jgi:DNA-binding IclR family transcriptional regulator